MANNQSQANYIIWLKDLIIPNLFGLGMDASVKWLNLIDKKYQNQYSKIGNQLLVKKKS